MHEQCTHSKPYITNTLLSCLQCTHNQFSLGPLSNSKQCRNILIFVLDSALFLTLASLFTFCWSVTQGFFQLCRFVYKLLDCHLYLYSIYLSLKQRAVTELTVHSNTKWKSFFSYSFSHKMWSLKQFREVRLYGTQIMRWNITKNGL